MDTRIGFDAKQMRHLNAARPRHARQVVAHQVDDHQVFGALLGVSGKRFALSAVGRHIGAARRGALHRPRRYLAFSDRKEQFGRQAKQPVFAGMDDAAIARAGTLSQPGISGQRIAVDRHVAGEGQVRLVNVTRADVFEDCLDPRDIIGLGYARHRRDDPGSGAIAEQGGDIVGGNPFDTLEQAEPT